MLMTIDEHAAPIDRPILPLFLDKDPCIYFLTHQHSRQVSQIKARPQVGHQQRGLLLVVAGTAAALREPELTQQLWCPTYRAWFPDGKDDREATALRVRVNRVYCWEPPRSRLIRVVQAVTAVATGRAVETFMKTVTRI